MNNMKTYKAAYGPFTPSKDE